MLPELQQETFSAFRDGALENTVLDAKTNRLLHLGAAMALGCEPCMRRFADAAQREGISPAEIGAAQAVVMAVAAGRVDAQLRSALGDPAVDDR